MRSGFLHIIFLYLLSPAIGSAPILATGPDEIEREFTSMHSPHGSTERKSSTSPCDQRNGSSSQSSSSCPPRRRRLSTDGVFDLTSLDGSNGFVINGATAGANLGNCAAAGDFNGDGIPDVALCAPNASPSGRSGAGETHIVYGKNTANVGNWASSFEISSLDGSNGFTINGVGTASNDRSGFCVSAGDFNGDGVSDVLIGAPWADHTGASNAGSVYVVYGKNTASVGDFSATFELSSLDGSNGFVIRGIDGNDLNGWSCANAGDFNGDGVDDIIVGAMWALSKAGEAYVVYGKNTAVDGDFSAEVALSSLDGSNGFLMKGKAAGNGFGYFSSTAGDFNGDGITDIIIGARWAVPTGGSSGAGEAYLVYGKNTAVSGDFAASMEISSLDGSTGVIFEGIDGNDYTGSAVASAGDFNADGVDDVIIGAISADGHGAAYLVFGKNTGVDGNFAATLDLSTIDGSNGVLLDGTITGGLAGWSVAGGADLNRDGIPDVVIGAPWADSDAGTEAGETYVVYGKNTAVDGAFSASVQMTSVDGRDGFLMKGLAASDTFGIFVANIGDFNGDGKVDFLAAAHQADPNSLASAGEVYMLLDAVSGVSVPELDECTQNIHNCDTKASCTNTDGSFTCACLSGYAGTGVQCAQCGSSQVTVSTDQGSLTWTSAIGSYGFPDSASAQSLLTFSPALGASIAVGNHSVTASASNSNNETTSCTIALTVQEFDECTQNVHNCDTNAACTNTDTSFTCACNSGYLGTGVQCDPDECTLNTHDCDSNAACTNTDGSFTCACNSGYAGTGVQCVQCGSSQVSVSTDQGSLTWTSVIGSFGFPDSASAQSVLTFSPALGASVAIGAHNVTASASNTNNDTTTCTIALTVQDPDECAQNVHDCDSNANCTNTDGSFACLCKSGYAGSGVQCDFNECTQNVDDCDSNAACTNTDGSFTCACNSGFAGTGVQCEADECAQNIHDCDTDATYTKIDGSFTCACNSGFAGTGVQCEFDECTEGVHTCDANAACNNTDTSFSCSCNEGFTGSGLQCEGGFTDTEAPLLVCPSTQYAEQVNGEWPHVSFDSPTVTDNVDSNLEISLSMESGAQVQAQTTVVEASATDSSGNRGTCTFTILVDVCPSSSVRTTAGGDCLCDPGYYRDTTASSDGSTVSCLSCVSNSTSAQGSVHPSACACKAGSYFVPNLGAESEDALNYWYAGTCAPCPQHATCKGGLIVDGVLLSLETGTAGRRRSLQAPTGREQYVLTEHVRPRPNDGYTLTTRYPQATVVACPVPSACKTGEQANYQEKDPGTLCAEGATGPLCNECSAGHQKSSTDEGESCQVCPPSLLSKLTLLGGIGGCLMVLVLFFNKPSRRAVAGEESVQTYKVIIKLTACFCATAAVLPAFFPVSNIEQRLWGEAGSQDVPLGMALSQLLEPLQVFSVGEILTLDCFWQDAGVPATETEEGFFLSLFLTALLPCALLVILAVGFFVAGLIAEGVGTCRRRRQGPPNSKGESHSAHAGTAHPDAAIETESDSDGNEAAETCEFLQKTRERRLEKAGRLVRLNFDGLRGTCGKVRSLLGDLLGPFLIVFFFSFSFVLGKFYEGIQCESKGNMALRLAVRPSILCSSGAYTQWSSILLSVLLVYSVGIPLSLLMALSFRRHRLNTDQRTQNRSFEDGDAEAEEEEEKETEEGVPQSTTDVLDTRSVRAEELTNSFGFALAGYRPEFFFWETVLFLRIALVFLILLAGRERPNSAQSDSRLVLLIVHASFFLWLQLTCKPFHNKRGERDVLNQVEASLLSCWLSLWCSTRVGVEILYGAVGVFSKYEEERLRERMTEALEVPDSDAAPSLRRGTGGRLRRLSAQVKRWLSYAKLRLRLAFLSVFRFCEHVNQWVLVMVFRRQWRFCPLIVLRPPLSLLLHGEREECAPREDFVVVKVHRDNRGSSEGEKRPVTVSAGSPEWSLCLERHFPSTSLEVLFRLAYTCERKRLYQSDSSKKAAGTFSFVTASFFNQFIFRTAVLLGRRTIKHQEILRKIRLRQFQVEHGYLAIEVLSDLRREGPDVSDESALPSACCLCFRGRNTDKPQHEETETRRTLRPFLMHQETHRTMHTFLTMARKTKEGLSESQQENKPQQDQNESPAENDNDNQDGEGEQEGDREGGDAPNRPRSDSLNPTETANAAHPTPKPDVLLDLSPDDAPMTSLHERSSVCEALLKLTVSSLLSDAFALPSHRQIATGSTQAYVSTDELEEQRAESAIKSSSGGGTKRKKKAKHIGLAVASSERSLSSLMTSLGTQLLKVTAEGCEGTCDLTPFDDLQGEATKGESLPVAQVRALQREVFEEPAEVFEVVKGGLAGAKKNCPDSPEEQSSRQGGGVISLERSPFREGMRVVEALPVESLYTLLLLFLHALLAGSTEDAPVSRSSSPVGRVEAGGSECDSQEKSAEEEEEEKDGRLEELHLPVCDPFESEGQEGAMSVELGEEEEAEWDEAEAGGGDLEIDLNESAPVQNAGGSQWGLLAVVEETDSSVPSRRLADVIACLKSLPRVGGKPPLQSLRFQGKDESSLIPPAALLVLILAKTAKTHNAISFTKTLAQFFGLPPAYLLLARLDSHYNSIFDVVDSCAQRGMMEELDEVRQMFTSIGLSLDDLLPPGVPVLLQLCGFVWDGNVDAFRAGLKAYAKNLAAGGLTLLYIAS
uniref:EGF-like domain-containing protein n=1 Tax=Chromera velia CCMP2878 TaxID=1169474 RepID=A0A0G4I7K3_9ALVE|eukprot:Cvel_11666.t1-p1 / transcript=Cvel_11666.t1 / gene=Cvel_11666 / organism=Chromera_velia_CCMP2878 / gene_product=Fibrillin-2, putative / transcript_product=Fibrillin-2, putative / location=Cvel_scaffold739:44334-65580(-) / protein_length=2672 / sequence_SO=supercontig / SO=protein_coding / is_pseudo=false